MLANSNVTFSKSRHVMCSNLNGAYECEVQKIPANKRYADYAFNAERRERKLLSAFSFSIQ